MLQTGRQASLVSHYKNNGNSSTESKKSSTYNGIISLHLNGEIVAYRGKTLCGDRPSKLAHNLSDDTWVRGHTVITENGKACILVMELQAGHVGMKRSIIHHSRSLLQK